ncbi:MAG: hypothetical protein ACFCGT_00435 [Sandaracinaceae bacterium]
MDLSDRLRKLATGLQASRAIDAPFPTVAPAPGDPEEARRHELLGILEVMFLMAAVDGEISDDEADQLEASVAALMDMGLLGDATFADTLNELNGRLAEEGWAARLEAATSRIRTPENRTFAFRVAATVAFVDDFVASAEAAAIESLAGKLALDREESQGLLREVHGLLFGERPR